MELKDEEYAGFHRKLIPNILPEKVIGVRTPALRKLAKQISRESFCRDFLKELPHSCFSFLFSDLFFFFGFDANIYRTLLIVRCNYYIQF